MAKRRDLEEPASASVARRVQPNEATAKGDELLALQRQAGNKAVAELLAHQQEQKPSTTPAMRLRDNLRAGRAPGQPEFGLGVQRAPEDLKAPGRLLRRGSRGADVAALQQLLGVPADGIFGPVTHAAVVAFQGSAGLAPDGIVGPLTRSALASGKVPTEKLPGPEVKGVPYESTEKLPPEPTDKLLPWETETGKS